MPNPYSLQTWPAILLWVRTLTFRLEATSQMDWFAKLLTSTRVPNLAQYITRLECPEFAKFAGNNEERLHNPYMQIATHLPNLSYLSLTYATEGITTSRWKVQEQIDMELVDPLGSHERRTLSIAEVVRKFDGNALFECNSLQVVDLIYLDQLNFAAETVRVGNYHLLAYDMRSHLAAGLATRQMGVTVNLQFRTT